MEKFDGKGQSIKKKIQHREKELVNHLVTMVTMTLDESQSDVKTSKQFIMTP